MYKVWKICSSLHKNDEQNFLKINKKNLPKDLQFLEAYGIIMKRDCDRYAVKREVAACVAGFSVEYVRF